ncbi:MAG: sigma-70 family RNA polymerase sigma factor [Acidobacteriota bacterium]|nr:sigma-70 family RNA polymerase sigma factor [Acidobacteriota bacterium]
MTDFAITQLLVRWSRGEKGALDDLFPAIERPLFELAQAYLRRERVGHTLEASALVNELYLKLVDQKKVDWQDRAHFFGVSAQIMRRILVDHARRKDARKRGNGVTHVTLADFAAHAHDDNRVDVLALDFALEKLAAIYPQQARIVELRFFAGLNIPETAAALGVSMSTVNRDWLMAKAWLRRELSDRGARSA